MLNELRVKLKLQKSDLIFVVDQELYVDIDINGYKLSILLFADDIALIADNHQCISPIIMA